VALYFSTSHKYLYVLLWFQRLREDLEGKLSAALGSMEMELRKYVTYDSAGIVHFQQSLSEEQVTVYTKCSWEYAYRSSVL